MRKTYHYDPTTKQMVAGRGPTRAEGSGDGWRFSDRIYSGTPFKGHDGTIIDSKRKHREYMKRNNLTTADDYTGEWARAKERREAVYTGQHDKAARREQVVRAIEQLQRKG
jgi:hypothetical protein